MSAVGEPLTQEDAWGMLLHIPSDDRETWVKVGGVLKDVFGSGGFNLWDQWSATAGNYEERAARDVWRGLGKNEIRAGIGSLIYLARAHGWNPERKPPVRSPEPRKVPPPSKDTGPYAATLWLACRADDAWVGGHPYVARKGIIWAAGAGRGTASGGIVGRNADCLIVPIRTDGDGKVQGVQAVNAEGKKQTFGKLADGYLLLGNTLDRRRWFVAEGWASAVSVVFHHLKGNGCCACAFGKSNLTRVAELIAAQHAPAEIMVLEEQD